MIETIEDALNEYLKNHDGYDHITYDGSYEYVSTDILEDIIKENKEDYGDGWYNAFRRV